jgi:arylsulfatase A-like enzyme
MLTAVCQFGSAAERDARPNILFIMSDDHGYQAIGAYGSRVNKTPNLDRIARDGMRFDRCFVTNSICGPARAVILTGKYSHLNGFVRNGNTFNGGQQTVAKLLQKAGYQTAVVGKWHLRSTPTGFNHYHVLIGQGPYYNPPMLTSAGRVAHTGYTTDIITDEALSWLKENRDPEKPFFLIYQHKAPHRNWQPGPKYLNKYDGDTIAEPPTLFDDYSGRGTPAKTQAMTVAKHLNPNDLKLTTPRGLTPEQLALWNKAYGDKNKQFAKAKLEGDDLVRWKYQRYVKDYLRCVDSVDENVGRVLDYLDETGLAENTIVFYTSDQGWYLGEHGWYDKRWMYEESFRTPLLVRWPGKTKAGSVSEDLVMNLDFAETFLDIAGVEIPADMQGRSLRGVLSGKTPEDWRDDVYYHYYEFPGAHSVRRHYGVRTDRYKLIYFYRIDEWELFDLRNDPYEMKSVYADPAYADTVNMMKARLEKARERYGDNDSVVDFGEDRAKKVKLQQVGKFDLAKLHDSGDAKGELTAGPHGPAIQPAASPVLRRETSPALDPAYKPMTIGAWIKPTAKDGVIMAQGGVSLGYALYLKDGTPTFAIRAGGQLKEVKSRELELNEWSHVVAVLDADGRGRLIVDGRPQRRARKLGFVSSAPADGFSLGADTGSFVGEYEDAQVFAGQIADPRVYWGVLGEDALKAWSSSEEKK